MGAFYFFSCLIALARTSNTALNRSGECMYHCLVSDFKGKDFIFQCKNLPNRITYQDRAKIIKRNWVIVLNIPHIIYFSFSLISIRLDSWLWRKSEEKVIPHTQGQASPEYPSFPLFFTIFWPWLPRSGMRRGPFAKCDP